MWDGLDGELTVLMWTIGWNRAIGFDLLALAGDLFVTRLCHLGDVRSLIPRLVKKWKL